MIANIFTQLPTLLVGAGGAIAKIAESFITFDWLGTMQTFMTNLATALSGAFTSLGIPASTQGALDIIFGFVDGLTAQLPQILNRAPLKLRLWELTQAKVKRCLYAL